MQRLLVLLLCARVAVALWGELECPLSCSCQLSELRHDLRAARWDLQDGDDAPELHPNEALHLTEAASPDFHGLLKTAVCVYQSEHGLDDWIHQLPIDVEALTIMQAAGGAAVVVEERHLSPLGALQLLDVQGAANGSSMQLKTNSLRGLRGLRYLSLRNIRFQGQPEVAPLRPPVRYSLQEVLADGLTRWKGEQPVVPHEIVFVGDDEPLPYPEYRAALDHADMSIFEGLEQLRVLRVDQCGLTQIKWQMFQGMKNLEWLSLEGNELMYVPDFAFYGTPHLKHLSLARNRILSMHFTNLAGLLELERLDLSRNNLAHLSELSLPPLPQLLEADFRHNPLEDVFRATFEVMNRTERLYLGGETPLRLQDGALSGLSEIRELRVTNVRVPVLELSSLSGVTRLKTLHLQGQVEELAYDAFAPATKLERLVLSDCQLRVVSMDAFYGLDGLRVLDLSRNKLETLPPGIFDQLASLKELQLYDNLFTTLPEDIFNQVPAKMIRLDQNPWECSCAMREWRPMAVNKVKVQVERVVFAAEAKGGAETRVRETQYRFEKRAAPTCATPPRFKGWSVFHVMRKELRCQLSDAKRQIVEKRRLEAKKLFGALRNNLSVSNLTRPLFVKPTKPTKAPTTPPAVEVTKMAPAVTETEKEASAPQSEPSNVVPEEPSLVHQGKVVRVSKKAWKLEMERKKKEKLRKLQLLDAHHEPSNLV